MKTQSWIKKNTHMYENLKPGQIYIVFETEKPIKVEDAGKAEYKSVSMVKNGVRRATSFRVSAKGNRLAMRISICEECREFKASKHLRLSLCEKCQRDYRNHKMLNRYYVNKPPNKKKKTSHADLDVYKGLDPGIIYVLFEKNEVIKLNDIKHLFKPGKKKLSPVTGAEYVGRICLCIECGKKRFNRVRIGDICKKCQNIRSKKARGYKNKVKTAQQMAFEITGDYEKVETNYYTEDVYFEVELIMEKVAL